MGSWESEAGDRELNQIPLLVWETPGVGLDWGEGDYARTAAVLAPAAEALVDAAGVGPGTRVLDVACGTGNAALAAAARGGRVTGIDASPRLVELASERARAAGADARFVVGQAEALPVEDAAFDAVLSSFGVIFADDAATAAAELVRATRTGGLVALTSWRPEGPIHAVGELLRGAFPEPPGTPARWGDQDWVAGLLIGAGADEVRVEGATQTPASDRLLGGLAAAAPPAPVDPLPLSTDTGWGEIVVRGDSPEAWMAEQEEHHPAWRWGRLTLGADAWAPLRERMVAALAEGNEDPGAFLTTSRYLVVRAAVLNRARGAGGPP